MDLISKWKNTTIFWQKDIDSFYKRCIFLDGTTVHNYHKHRKKWKLFSSWAISDCTRYWKCHWNTIVFAKAYFLLHVSVGILDFLHVRWTKILNLLEPLVTGTRTWRSHSVVSKCWYYMQYYMMVLEQCGPIMAKVQATNTWSGEERAHVCSVTCLDYSFAFT